MLKSPCYRLEAGNDIAISVITIREKSNDSTGSFICRFLETQTKSRQYLYKRSKYRCLPS